VRAASTKAREQLKAAAADDDDNHDHPSPTPAPLAASKQPAALSKYKDTPSTSTPSLPAQHKLTHAQPKTLVQLPRRSFATLRGIGASTLSQSRIADARRQSATMLAPKAAATRAAADDFSFDE
jgi:hypothetical protein